MYQQSVDRSGNSAKKDMWLFILLLILFFLFGAVMLYLENLLKSRIPRYVFIGLILAALYLIYRRRLIGFRYTVFYKELEPVYDPRFDAVKPVESYPYPVGTVIFERIVSAKGSILLKLDAKDIISIEPCRIDDKSNNADVLNVYAGKKINAYKLTYRKDGSAACVIFNPDEEFLMHLHEAMKYKPSDSDEADD